ncbi:hypothetical protein Pryu01_01850 [Paraliobacillus ryukyuensis]|uniref:Uncharacterized protein n=2 Tax=Paraliobacillus ryukyuensis TaxID=200904 RepID=A0A366DVB4_9BACI|nr:hypothetical protein [Paraliobacillus ryukyuensis]RBO93184.1 hypothetical protein DES48_11350 [Paraliobacillus ryukyuensis]
MTEQEKERYFYWIVGQLGLLILMISQLNNIAKITDNLGFFLALISIFCFSSFIRYVESQLFPDKTKGLQIMKRIFVGSVIVSAVIFFSLN